MSCRAWRDAPLPRPTGAAGPECLKRGLGGRRQETHHRPTQLQELAPIPRQRQVAADVRGRSVRQGPGTSLGEEFDHRLRPVDINPLDSAA